MREKTLQTAVLNYLNSLPRCRAENVSGNAQQSGRADINGCINGRAFRLELKSPDNRNTATKKQQLDLRRWQAAGTITMIAYSLAFVRDVFLPDGSVCDRDYYSREEKNGMVSWVVIPEVV